MDHEHDQRPGQIDEPPFWRSRYGLGLVVFGFLLQWPTLLTLLMFPMLLVMYARLALTEETEMRTQFGEVFESYAQRTPPFLPRMGQGSTAG